MSSRSRRRTPRRLALRPGSLRGFTLVELMVVVIIVGVLAAIGIAALRAHVFGAKTGEALAMIQSIRAAQERWRAENLVYLNVSASEAWYPAAPPAAGEERFKRAFFLAGGHADDEAWKLLNPTVPGPVEFGYRVNAGGPSDAMTPPAVAITRGSVTWPNPPGAHWYVIQALGNADGDSVYSFFMTSSLRSEIYRQNEGE